MSCMICLSKILDKRDIIQREKDRDERHKKSIIQREKDIKAYKNVQKRMLLFYGGEDKDCVICFEEVNIDLVSFLKCGHFYHDNCIKMWKNHHNTCPYCRSEI